MAVFGEPHIPVIGYEGVTYGSAFLKSLQSEKLPELDLLVRESVQNSSDAAIGFDAKNFRIDYTFGQFNVSGLTAELGAVGKKLEEYYGNIDSFLEIRDSKTSGLTGPYDADFVEGHNHGNYFKLVFDTGINQTQDGAGGNWGFGKSVYYRVSRAGLVAFYTRIRDEELNSFQERLIVAMVEDESSEHAVLKTIKDNPTGRAWWGRSGSKNGVVWPVTEHNAIVDFLALFGLDPFSGDKTGTSVIIPYVDESKLLEDVIPQGELQEDERARCTFANSVPEYLKHSLQKWYAPRLFNKVVNKIPGKEKWIRARVNEMPVGNDDMQPFFKLVKELYNVALFRSKGIEYEAGDTSIECKDIFVNKESLQEKRVGCVAYIKFTNRYLYPYGPGLSPYVLTGNFENDPNENEPIVMFAREPGMVICYSIDGTWSKGVTAPRKNPASAEEEYVLAFFVPCTENKFTDADKSRKRLFKTLGGYLRKCEESDHASWEDKAKFRLISKIKGHVGRKIGEGVKSRAEEIAPGQTSRLSQGIGKILMPSRDMFAPACRKAGGGGSNGASGSKKAFFIAGMPLWRGETIVVPYELKMGDKRTETIVIEIQAESGTISLEAWEKEIRTEFPVEIVSASASLVKRDGEELRAECLAGERYCEKMLSVELPVEGSRASKFKIACDSPGQLITGEIELHSYDRSFECAVKAV